MLGFSALVVADEAPAEFVTQVLEPGGGKILRPKDWFYAEFHNGPVLKWVLSREDTSGDMPYVTGVSINVIPYTKERTGMIAPDYIRSLIVLRKQEATRIIKDCRQQKGEIFTRICLETEEGPLHKLYTFFWGNNGMDLAVVTIASSTKDQWATYRSTFDKMSAFELLDSKRKDPSLADESTIDNDEAPTKFVTQVLKPTQGTILRPKDWFYAEKHLGPQNMWTLSLEDPAAAKPYQTGLSIQTFSGFKPPETKTPKQLMLEIHDHFVKTATKVLFTCEPKDQGVYTFTCMETEERGFHIRYAFFWGSHEESIAVLVTAGAPIKLWDKYAPTFDKMGAFEHLDPKLLEE
jgi:hypothetical protein